MDYIDNSLYLDSLKKNYSELLEQGIARMRARTNITDFSSGSIAKSYLEVYYEDIEDIYFKLFEDSKRAYLSTSYGSFLEDLGNLVSCERESGLSDEDYKYKITKNPQLKAKGNEEAIKYACRKVDGVNDVEVKKFTRGIGSFDIYVITEDPEFDEEILENVQKEIDKTQSSGMDGKAVRPNIINLDLHIRYIFEEGTSSEIRATIRNNAKNRVKQHFINKDLGSDIIITELIHLFKAVDPTHLKDVQVTDMYIDGVQTLITNKSFDWDQRVIADKVIIN